MTPEDIDKTKAAFTEYLTRIGYPNITNEQIMEELPNLFRFLDSKDLIPQKMTFQMFQQIATQRYFIAKFTGASS